MKTLRFFIVIFCLSLYACNTTDDSTTPPNTDQFNLVWETSTNPFLPQGIVIDKLNRDYFYVAAKGGGLLVFDNSSSPATQIASIPITNFGDLHAMHLSQQGNYLYLALGDFFGSNSKAGMAIVDITNPTTPSITDTWETPTVVKGSAIVITEGNYAYLGAMNQGVYVFDVSDKSNITQTDQFIPDLDFPIPNPSASQEPNARGMAIRGNDLFLCYDAGGIRILDITDKSNLTEKSRYINDTFNKQKAYNNILLNGNYAYVATDYCGMEILDISDPNAVTRVSWCNPWNCDTNSNLWINSEGHTNQLVYDAVNNCVALSSGGSEVTLIDVSNPNNCSVIASYGSRSNNLGTWGLDMKGDKVYVTYITTVIPFSGTWSGIKCIKLK